MDVAGSSQVKSPFEPPRTVGHAMVVYKGSMIVWGGYNRYPEDRIVAVPADVIYIFPATVASTLLCLPNEDRHCLKWFSRSVYKGEVPECASGAFALVWRLRLIVFGGYCLSHRRRHLNSIYMLDFQEEQWYRYSHPKGIIPTPRDKMTGWVHQDRCYYFGGYGIMDSESDGTADFVLDVEFAWNNQLLIFNPVGDGNWSKACVSGSVPSPRACSSAVYMADRGCTIIFGGRHRDFRLNDLYVLDMNSLIFSEILINGPERPVGRSWSSLNLVGPLSMILFGGCANDGSVLGDLWIMQLDFEDNDVRACWKRIRSQLTPSFWHTAAIVNGYLFVHGGSRVFVSQPVPAVVFPRRVAPASLVTISLANVYNLLKNTDHILLPLALRNYLRSIKAVNRTNRRHFSKCRLDAMIDFISINA